MPERILLEASKNTPNSVRDGPVPNRRCTDFLCCIMYLLLVAAVVLGTIFLMNDSVQGYERPFDYDHNPCLGEYPILYIPAESSNNSVCVHSCPASAGVSLACKTNSVFATCPSSVSGLKLDTAIHVCTLLSDKKHKADRGFFKTFFDAILEARNQIAMTAGLIIAISFVLTLGTFILPRLAGYFFVVLLQILLVLTAAGFLFRYVQGRLPFVDANLASGFQHNNVSLYIGIAFAVAALVSLVVLFSRCGKLKFVVTTLKISARCFFQNWFMLVLSILLSGLSIIALVVNIQLLYNAQSLGTINRSNHGAYDQFDPSPQSRIFSIIILLEWLWTHGMLISLANFVFESYAAHWYFNERVRGPGYFRYVNFSETLRLLFWHFGTVVFGSINAYFPESLNTWINGLQKNAPTFYNWFCCLHKCCFQKLSTFSHVETVLQSISFTQANQYVYYLRKRCKNNLPQLYMVGNFYVTSAKTFIWLLSVLVCYFLLIKTRAQYFTPVVNLIAPLVIIAFTAAQIATHFLDITGLVGDTIVLMYTADLEIERHYYGGAEPFSCPRQVKVLIDETKGVEI